MNLNINRNLQMPKYVKVKDTDHSLRVGHIAFLIWRAKIISLIEMN